MGTEAGLIVVNFSHPLTATHLEQIVALAGQPVARVIDVPTQFDESLPFASQAAELVASAGLTAAEWQTLPLLVNLPSYAPIVAALLAYLHGLGGYFPAVIRLRPRPGTTPVVFEVSELLDLQSIRNRGRSQR
jgi:hypothetical protein